MTTVNIDAKQVAVLREKTGAGMMDCRKALVESNGDIEAAVDVLRKNGAASAALAKAVGFTYHWEEAEKQYAHASAAYAIAPDGTISRYLFGIVFDPKTVRFAMLEASKGNVGTVVDKLILLCFHWDEKTNKVTLAAFNIMRAGGILVMLILGAFLVPFWFGKKKENVR